MDDSRRRFLDRVRVLCVAGIVLASAASVAVARNWPGWRGDGSGVSAETSLPVQWDAETNIVWRTALPGEGNSSPVVWGGSVFVTAATENGAKRHVICLGAEDGRIIWQTELTPTRKTRTYKKTGFAAPTPATNGRRVFAFFDSPGLVALDMDGRVVWQHDLGPFRNQYNMAGSPVLCDDVVIVCCDHRRGSFIAAFDEATGDVRWRTPRSASAHSSTPLVITVQAKKQIVANAKTVIAYDAATGKELWSCRGMKPYVTPSPVFDGALVYAVSGRNGPAMAIDPTGIGDVSETHVRAHYAIGGPYVPSPVVYPHLFLPGDNGALRCLDRNGDLVVEKRLNAHFSASLVAADNRLYWTSEKGNTYVIDVTTVRGGAPAMEVISVNPLGEKVLASPAIANGRIFIRTDKRLFCIAGNQKPRAPKPVSLASLGSAELEKLYDDNMGKEQEIEKVSRRLEIVGILGRRPAAEAVPFLKRAAHDHNDVGEEAVKLLGLHGEQAVPALLELVAAKPTGRLYLTIVPAEHLGRMKVAAAVPALLRLVRHKQPLVRIAALKAMAEIAQAHKPQAPAIVQAMVAALDDREGIVRCQAIDGLARRGDSLGRQRDGVVRVLLDLAADRNPMVAGRARRALVHSIKVSEERWHMDEILYGAQRKDPVVDYLRAGPIRVKFQDGELRYPQVGDKEIVRRIYFALRDARFDTIMPDFHSIKVRKRKDSFDISIAATCKSGTTDYSWRGLIAGTAEGRITFTVLGKANMDFKSPRLGLNVLYGAESLAGQKYVLSGVTGKDFFEEQGGVQEGVFPKAVSPRLLTRNYRTLRYTTADGMDVITSLALVHFGMEDQRNFGDSSYKAFSGIPHRYPDVASGDTGGQTLVLEVRNARPGPVPVGSLAVRGRAPIVVRIGDPVRGARMPALVPADQSVKGQGFSRYNHPRRRKQYVDARRIVLPYTPAMHQPDEDTFMENLPCIVDQVAAIRSFARKAAFRVDPLTIDSRFRKDPDPRNRGLFAGAWCARAVKYLALAGVDEAVFKVGPGYAALIQKQMGACAGMPVLGTSVGPHEALDVLAVSDRGRRIVWVINKTDRPQAAILQGLKGITQAHVIRVNAATSVQSGLGPARTVSVADGSLRLELAAFEVCVLTEGEQ